MATQPPRKPPPRGAVPPPGNRGMSEFSGVLGDAQGQGSGHPVRALVFDPMVPRQPPQPGSLAAKAAAAANQQLQVQSTFDARLLGSFDFATSFTTDHTVDPGEMSNSFQVPEGYTLIVRRIECAIFPPLSGTDTKTFIAITPLYDNNALVLNRVELWGVVEAYGWDTYHVCEQGHSFGVIWEAGPSDAFEIGFRFFGNLIRTMGRPAITEPGSPPLAVRGG